MNASAGRFVAPGSEDAGLAGTDLLLRDAARRACRTGGVALAVHLSRLPPADQRPHHHRIARALLQEAALRQEGQVFALRNGDLALVSRRADPAWEGANTEQALPNVLARLLRPAASAAGEVVSLWRLPGEQAWLFDYLQDCAAALPPAVQAAPSLAAPSLAASSLAVPRGAPPSDGSVTCPGRDADGGGDAPRIVELLHRQTSILLGPSRTLALLYRHVGYGDGTLAAVDGGVDPLPGTAMPDPFLLRHRAERFDHAVLSAVAAAWGNLGPLDPAAPEAGPLHLGLGLAALGSDAFARLADLCHAAACRLGVEVPLLDVLADPAAYRAARARLAAAGMTLALGGITAETLAFACPGALPVTLRPDLLVVDWSASLAATPRRERGEEPAATLAAFGPDRIVLARADEEGALRWGMAQGIRRFRGRHVDAILAAARHLACPAASGCTLGQCIGRAAAASPAGRRLCRAPAWLDAGLPPGAALPSILMPPVRSEAEGRGT